MSTTTNTGLNKPDYNSTVPTWDQPLNYNETILDSIFGNTTSIAMPTGATSTTTLTGPASSGSLGQTQSMRILLTGALSANQYLQIPAGIGGRWIVYNTCTGTSNVYITSGGGGTSVVAPQSYNVSIYSDGTNIRYTDDGLTNNFSTLTVLGNTYLATQSGSVGIGTTSPAKQLEVKNTTGTSIQVTGTATTSSYPGFIISSGTQSVFTMSQSASDGTGYVSNAAAAPIVFQTSNTERARIDSSGNLLVGTTSTYGKLSVSVGTNRNFGVTTPEVLSTGIKIQSLNDAGNANQGIEIRGGPIAFFYNASESMRIDTSGNLNVNGAVTAPSGYFSSGVQGTTIASQGYGVRVVAGSGDTAGLIQFTNNAISAQWSSISSTNGVINLNSTTTNANAINASSVNATSYSGGLVTSVAAGSGISVSANQGAVTITSAGIGINQSWQNVSRALGSTYTNSTGSPIMVIVSVASGAGNYQTLSANVNGTSFLIGQDANSGGATYCTGTFVVPNGHYYIVTGTGGAGLQQWVELR